jgi:hypothetical protein
MVSVIRIGRTWHIFAGDVHVQGGFFSKAAAVAASVGLVL